jgi:uncharacterized membrane protein YkvA (DUF1232 family)
VYTYEKKYLTERNINLMNKTQNPPTEEYDLERAERFYTKLRRRITTWLNRHTGIGDKVRNALLLLPDLFALVIRLIRDPRIDHGPKLQLIAVTAYVISPIDLVPDFLLPLGLIDDTVALAFVLGRIVRMMDQGGKEVLREHWEGDGDVLDRIQWIASNASAWLGAGTLARLKQIIRGGKRRTRQES